MCMQPKASKTQKSGLTASRKTKIGRVDFKKRARELRELRRDLQEVWGDLMMTLRLMIEELEGR
jgi:hypothetical protein